MYEYKAKMLRVVDGDTIYLEIDLGFHIHVREKVRLLHANTPETFGVKKNSEEYKKGMEAKLFVQDQLLGKTVTIKTAKDKRGKYGRYLAEIIMPDGKVLNQVLIDKGFAEFYTEK